MQACHVCSAAQDRAVYLRFLGNEIDVLAPLFRVHVPTNRSRSTYLGISSPDLGLSIRPNGHVSILIDHSLTIVLRPSDLWDTKISH